MSRHLLLGRSAHVLRHLRALIFGEPRRQPNPEQMAAMRLYSTSERRVRAVPTRRPVNRKGDAA